MAKAKTSPTQKKSVGRVMHEYKHGELKSGRGGKVKSRRQAIAIALHEAGASNEESKSKNKRALSRTKSKERRGKTGQQEREGKSHLGARGRPESSRAMGGKNATRGRKPSGRKSSGRKSSGSSSRQSSGTHRRSSSSAGKSGTSRKSSARKSAARKSSGRKTKRKSSSRKIGRKTSRARK